jgi:hypothetical protein
MNSESRIGLGLVVAVALCCVGPLALSLIGSEAALSVLSGLWPDVRVPLMGLGALLVIVGILVLRPRQRGSPSDKEEHR